MQRSKLFSVLFNMLVNNVLNEFTEINILGIEYADDIVC